MIHGEFMKTFKYQLDRASMFTDDDKGYCLTFRLSPLQKRILEDEALKKNKTVQHFVKNLISDYFRCEDSPEQRKQGNLKFINV